MRQAGIIAAPGIVALEQMTDRLMEGRIENARLLAAGLAEMPGMAVDLSAVQTNTVVFTITDRRFTCETFLAAAHRRGVNFSEFKYGRIRAVVRHGTPEGQIRKALQILAEVVKAGAVEETAHAFPCG